VRRSHRVIAVGVVPLLAVLALGTATSLSSAAASPPPVVQTTDGAVGGVLNGSVKEWRGIPYAAAPLGDLRWRPPAPVTPWAGTRAATTFASPCIQPDFASGGTLGSEDCLYLNVFAPDTATADSHLAVMVHLHPGGNSLGQAFMDASAFTARNVIVVTLNYRLGVAAALGREGGMSNKAE
jgi:para-nitrobenzyl esterase